MERAALSVDNFYNTLGWHKLRSKTLARWRSLGLPCGFCGQPLGFGIKGAVVVDHIKNRRQHPELALEVTNVQCVHGGPMACNTKKYFYQESNKRIEVNASGFPTGSEWE